MSIANVYVGLAQANSCECRYNTYLHIQMASIHAIFAFTLTIHEYKFSIWIRKGYHVVSGEPVGERISDEVE